MVETVGVGQVEVEVAGTCDAVVVVVNPGWGDAVQANKAGLLELADVLVINKADLPGVKETRRDLAHMLQMSSGLDWTPPIVETVAQRAEGIAGLFDALLAHREHLEQAGALEQRRRARLAEEALRLAAASYGRLLQVALGRLAPEHAPVPAGVAAKLAEEGAEVLARLAAGDIDPAGAAEALAAAIAGSLSE
jgi:putative protein kinase ArgK-like GTPase of G3E family